MQRIIKQNSLSQKNKKIKIIKINQQKGAIFVYVKKNTMWNVNGIHRGALESMLAY